MTDEREIIEVSDEVIAVLAVNATLKTDGVACMAGDIYNALSKNLLGKELVGKGIKVAQYEGSVEIDVNIIVKYGHKIPSVAWDIQENVKKEINTMTGLRVAAVNIHVQGVEHDDQK